MRPCASWTEGWLEGESWTAWLCYGPLWGKIQNPRNPPKNLKITCLRFLLKRISTFWIIKFATNLENTQKCHDLLQTYNGLWMMSKKKLQNYLFQSRNKKLKDFGAYKFGPKFQKLMFFSQDPGTATNVLHVMLRSLENCIFESIFFKKCDPSGPHTHIWPKILRSTHNYCDLPKPMPVLIMFANDAQILQKYFVQSQNNKYQIFGPQMFGRNL